MDVVIAAEADSVSSLLTGRGWTRDRRRPLRWTQDGTVVDVIPATPERIQEGTLLVGDNELSLVGFDLALRHAVATSVEGVDVPVASLPALTVLKMVSWLDRPYERAKDLGDLARILDNALDDFDERRWESPLADVPVDDQSAFFVGRLVGAIAEATHLAAVERFFEEIARSTWTAALAQEGQYQADDPEAMAQRRLAAFRRGLGR
jgi:predicted nucleotidyltransferase